MSKATEAKQKIIDMLEEEEQTYELLVDNPGDKSWTILVGQEMIIDINKKNGKVSLSFHTWTYPVYSANATLRMADLGLNIDIYSSFFFDDDGHYIDGDAAIDLAFKKQTEETIARFLKEALEAREINKQMIHNKGKKLH